MEKLNILICEDTKEEQEILSSFLDNGKIEVNYTIFDSGEKLLLEFVPDKFDLLLMDIYMGGITGVQTANKIRKVDEDIPIAFITTSIEHTLESYRLSVLKYIEKPYKQKDIDDILQLAMLRKQNVPSILINHGGKYEKIPYKSILFFEQMAQQLAIVLKNGEVVTIYGKLSSFDDSLLENGFFKPHHSFFVNLAHVHNIDTELRCFLMENDKNIPIRRELMSKARKAFEGYLFNKTRGCAK